MSAVGFEVSGAIRFRLRGVSASVCAGHVVMATPGGRTSPWFLVGNGGMDPYSSP